MRILQDLKLKHLSLDKKINGIPKVTGCFKPTDWTIRDRNILRKLKKQYFNPQINTKSWVHLLIIDLHTNHRDTWRKFYFFGRTKPMLCGLGFLHHYNRAIANKICPECNSVWLETDFPSCCWVCKKADPEKAKKIHYETRERLLRERPDYEEWVIAKAKKGMDTFEKKWGKGKRRAMQVPELRKKMELTMLQKYNASSYNASKEGRVSISKKITDWCKSNPEKLKARTAAGNTAEVQSRRIPKVTEAWYSKTSEERRIITRKREKTCARNNDGYKNPMQHPEIHARANSKSSLKRKVDIDGVIHTVQGGAEESLILKMVLYYGNDRNIVTQFNKKLYPKDLAIKICGYKPDFYIFSKDVFIECKSTYYLYGLSEKEYERNKLKAYKGGNKLKWIIQVIPKQQIFIQLPMQWYKWKKTKLIAYLHSKAAIKKAQLLSKQGVGFTEALSQVNPG